MIRSTLWITTWSLINIALAFILQILLAAQFGATATMDAYLVAGTIPALLMGLLPAALNICLIPIFVEYVTRDQQKTAFSISNGVIILFGLGLTTLVIIGSGNAGWIITKLAPGFDSHSTALSLSLFRILLPTVLFYGLANILSGVFYAQRKPFWPAFTPIFRVAGMLLAVLLGKRWGVFALAWGDLIGTVFAFAVLAFIYVRGGYHRFWEGMWTPEVKRVFLLLLPWLIGFSLGKAHPIVERIIASTLVEGSITHLSYAYQLMALTVTVITKGLSLSLFPVLSAMATKGDGENLQQLIGQVVRGLLLVMMPVTALIIVFGQPAIQLLFERGAFDQTATQGTYSALIGYVIALLALPMGVVITNTFYAFQDTKTVAIIAAFGFLVNLILNVILAPLLGVTGLAIGYSITAAVNLLIMNHLLQRRIGRIIWWNRNTSSALSLLVLLSLLFFFIQKHYGIGDGATFIDQIIHLSMGSTLFGLSYLLIGHALGIAEFQQVFRRVATILR